MLLYKGYGIMSIYMHVYIGLVLCYKNLTAQFTNDVLIDYFFKLKENGGCTNVSCSLAIA